MGECTQHKAEVMGPTVGFKIFNLELKSPPFKISTTSHLDATVTSNDPKMGQLYFYPCKLINIMIWSL